jgi:hypothetical protein
MTSYLYIREKHDLPKWAHSLFTSLASDQLSFFQEGKQISLEPTLLVPNRPATNGQPHFVDRDSGCTQTVSHDTVRARPPDPSRDTVGARLVGEPPLSLYRPGRIEFGLLDVKGHQLRLLEEGDVVEGSVP